LAKAEPIASVGASGDGWGIPNDRVDVVIRGLIDMRCPSNVVQPLNAPGTPPSQGFEAIALDPLHL